MTVFHCMMICVKHAFRRCSKESSIVFPVFQISVAAIGSPHLPKKISNKENVSTAEEVKISIPTIP